MLASTGEDFARLHHIVILGQESTFESIADVAGGDTVLQLVAATIRKRD